jgi:outer membrane protein
MRRARMVLLAIVGSALVTPTVAYTQSQTPVSLTLAEAQARAVAHHPRVAAAQDIANAANQAVRQADAAKYPAIIGSLTAADALSNSRIAAGGLNNPIILDRYSNGIAASQIVTDFGRTGSLVASATLRQDARASDVAATRADVELRVTTAYFAALGAQAVLRVAEDTVRTRQVVADQVTTLAQNQLKSDLDVSFARVDLGQAQLLLVEAQSDVRARFADLTAAMGESGDVTYTLVDPTQAAAPPPGLATLADEALRARPDLVSARLDADAARRYVSAQAALARPVVSFLGAAGVSPWRQDALASRYAAAGITLNVPIFNGHLFSAAKSEAESRADAESEHVRDLENRVTHDVRVAWLQASSAFERIALTDQLVARATQAQSLAQSRYDLGLSSIVELSQAQLNATQARLSQASARYEYAAALAFLRYQSGQTP